MPIWFLVNLFSPTIAYYKKTYLVTLGSAIGGAFNLVLNLLFTFKLGFVFSAFIILPTSIIILFVYSIVLKKRFSHRPLPSRKLLAFIFAFLLLASITLFLSVSLLARAFLCAAILMLLFPELKKLKLLISE